MGSLELQKSTEGALLGVCAIKSSHRPFERGETRSWKLPRSCEVNTYYSVGNLVQLPFNAVLHYSSFSFFLNCIWVGKTYIEAWSNFLILLPWLKTTDELNRRIHLYYHIFWISIISCYLFVTSTSPLKFVICLVMPCLEPDSSVNWLWKFWSPYYNSNI